MSRALDRFEGLEPPVGLNPAFVARVRKRRREAAEQAARQQQAARALREREETARREREAVDAEIAALDAERKLAERQAVLEAARVAAGRKPARAIIRDVAARHGLAMDVVLGASRTKHVVAARFEAIALVRLARPDLSLPALGRIFNRDHTTILHALKRKAMDIVAQPRRADGRFGGGA